MTRPPTEFGPWEDGFMSIDGDGDGVVVWVGANQSYGTFPVDAGARAYWHLAAEPLPFTAPIVMTAGTGSPPAYAANGPWHIFANQPFGPAGGQPITCTGTPADPLYRVKAFEGGQYTAPTFYLWMRNTGGPLTYVWIAANLPPQDRWLFQTWGPGNRLELTPLPGVHSFDSNHRSVVVSEVTLN